MSDEGATRHRLFEAESTPTVPAGTSLLVTASGAAGETVVTETLCAGVNAGDSAVVLTTDGQAPRVVDALREAVPTADLSTQLRVIDTQKASPEVDVADALVGRNVDTPRNLTDIGIAFKDVLDEFEAAEPTGFRFGLLSLSVILSYVDQETTYRFCQTLQQALRDRDAIGLFQVDTDLHDDATVGTLERAFDGVVEVETAGDSDGGAVRARVTGIEETSDDWVHFDG